MKGLLIKELLSLRQYIKIFVGLILFFIILGIASEDISIMGTIVITMPLIIIITSFSYDTANHWPEFAACFPFTRRHLVFAKYCFALLLVLAITALTELIGTVYGLIFSQPLDAFTANLAVLFGTSLILLSLIMPLIYKFGVEKSRYLMVIIVMIPFILIACFSSMIETSLEKLQTVQIEGSLAFGLGFALLVLLCFGVSYQIALKIFKKKDL